GFYPFDLLIAIFLFSAYWFKRFFRNVRQVEDLSKELIKADKHKDEFLANTSHELRNPLHGMINIAQNLLDKKDNKRDATDNKNLELLITIGRRMSLLLNDLLDITQLKENGLRLHTKTLKVQSIVSGTMD